MVLFEFFHFNNQTNDLSVDLRYRVEDDQSVVKRKDTRKLKLTLRQINQLRHQTEAHEFEKESELEFIRQMYGQPAAEPAQ